MLGDIEAGPTFDDAFDGIYLLAFSVGRRILGDVHEAQDIAAETASRALVRWRTLAQVPHLDAWVKRVATNLAIDVVRKRSRNRAFVETTSVSPADIEHLDGEAVARLLAPLPRRQSEVLGLRYAADASDADIAAALGISVGAVKKHAARGLASLRKRASRTISEVNIAY